MHIETGGKTFSLRAPFVVVANNRYSGHVLDYSLRPQLDSGRLWIYTTRAGRHLAILRLMWQSITRAIDDVDGLEKFEVTEAALSHEGPRLPVAVDGELVDLEAPWRFRVRPGALHVIVPAEQPDRK
jgi:diacylglycerol kinase family enzyme